MARRASRPSASVSVPFKPSTSSKPSKKKTSEPLDFYDFSSKNSAALNRLKAAIADPQASSHSFSDGSDDEVDAQHVKMDGVVQPEDDEEISSESEHSANEQDVDLNEDESDEEEDLLAVLDRAEKMEKFVDSLPHKKASAFPDSEDAFPDSEDDSEMEDVPAQPVPQSGKVTMEDLLKGLSSEEAATLSKSLKPLTSAKAAPLTAPLPLLHQAKLERQVARESLAKSVDQWDETVRQMRGIPARLKEDELTTHDGAHEVLKLPLQREAPAKPSGRTLAATFKPQSALEQQVTSLITDSSLSVADLQQEEASFDLPEQSNQAASARDHAKIAQLRLDRELLFRSERKAKMVKKIKSKTYRKIANKTKRRAAEAGLDDDSDVDEDGVREKKELQRLKERATLRHSAKRGFSFGGHGDGDERIINQERLSQEDAIRRKILELSDQERSDYSEESESDEEADEATIRKSAFDELASLRNDQATVKGSSLLQMKFMQKAQAEKDRLLDDMILDAQNELNEQESEEDDDQAPGRKIQGNNSRLSFAPSKAGKAVTTETAKTSRPLKSTKLASNLEVQVPTLSQPTSPSEASSSTLLSYHAPSAPPTATANPWLASSVHLTQSRKSSNLNPNTDSSKTLKARKKAKAEKKKQAELDKVDISLDKTLLSRNSDDEDVEMETEVAMNGPLAFKQRDLVAQAFAADDVVAEFEAEKAAAIQGDAPQELDLTLPGWGSWGGKAVPKKQAKAAKTRRITRIVPGIDAAARTDANIPHAIISQKQAKASGAGKYLVKDLPFPYTGMKQWEMKMQDKVGKEWKTATGLQTRVMPNVVVKQGAVIKPVQKKL